jgi:hypothetical protein
MRHVRRISGAALIVMLALFAGVQGSPALSGASAQDAAPEDQQPVATDADDLLAEATRAVPAFGGMFLDDDGNLNLYLLDSSQKVQAEAAIESVFGADRFEGATVKVLEADFAFADLHRWRQDMRRWVLGLPGVVSLDIDETRNRISVGLEEMEAQAAVEAELAKLGVPRDAVILEVDTPVTPSATLQQKVRPTKGGLQIKRPDWPHPCTLGFSAKATGSGTKGFVTASHCTEVQGGVEDTVFYQPTVSAGNKLGREIGDPGYWTGTICPPGRRCRFSDSAFVRWNGSVSRMRHIAKTRLDSIDIVGTYRVVGEVALPAVGQTLNKTGRTTGRTEGDVDKTCEDTDVAGKDITLLCQNRVRADAADGDSGAPVFRITDSPRYNDVELYGVQWGVHEGVGYWFSSMYTIQLELGSLETCVSGFSC